MTENSIEPPHNLIAYTARAISDALHLLRLADGLAETLQVVYGTELVLCTGPDGAMIDGRAEAWSETTGSTTLASLLIAVGDRLHTAVGGSGSTMSTLTYTQIQDRVRCYVEPTDDPPLQDRM
ncbi:MAG: hypothetical protein JWN67_431 [Actinomycetia bacterium]|nr:hypothetical protein [Actinomycetes bacterium]